MLRLSSGEKTTDENAARLRKHQLMTEVISLTIVYS